MTSPPGILRLPPEIRQDVFIAFFRSFIIRLNGSSCKYGKKLHEPAIAILSVCGQFYREAEPLLLPNVQVYCTSNAAVMETLMKLGPERITQLRHLCVSHIPVGFNLEPYGGLTDADLAQYADDYEEDLNNWDEGIPRGVRHFHIGAVLGLFPGLRLDLLEVFNGTGGNPWTGQQTTDCLGSLLEADGYRRLWMDAAGGDGGPWLSLPSTHRWKGAIERQFTPHGGQVSIKLEDYEWKNVDTDEFWQFVRDAGITLIPPEDDSDDSDVSDDESEDADSLYSSDSEDAAVIVADRGVADYVVKPDDGQVLRCIVPPDSFNPMSPEDFQAASDALRKLVRENSWESIRAMDGFDDGCRGYDDGPGNRVYSNI